MAGCPRETTEGSESADAVTLECGSERSATPLWIDERTVDQAQLKRYLTDIQSAVAAWLCRRTPQSPTKSLCYIEMKNSKPQNFETSLEELERIVRELERGDLPLEKSLELFEQGVKLSRACQERLNEAERRIEILTRDSQGRATVSEFEAEDESNDDDAS